MQLNELIESEGLEIVNEKTNISIDNLKKLVAVAIVIVIAIVIIVLLCFPQKYLIIPIFIVYLIICLLVGCNESNKDIIKKICKILKNFKFKELNFLFLLIILWCLLVILIIPTISFIDGDVIKTISQPIAMLDNQTMILFTMLHLILPMILKKLT